MDWGTFFIWAGIIAGVILYLFVTVATFAAASEGAKDAAKRRDVHRRRAAGFEDTLAGITRPERSLFVKQTRERLEDAQREARVENLTAIISLWVMYTPFLWPLWFVIFGLSKAVTMSRAARKTVKS